MTWRELFLRAWKVLRNRFWREPPTCSECGNFKLWNEVHHQFDCVDEDCQEKRATQKQPLFKGSFSTVLAPGFRKALIDQATNIQQQKMILPYSTNYLVGMEQHFPTKEEKEALARAMQNISRLPNLDS